MIKLSRLFFNSTPNIFSVDLITPHFNTNYIDKIFRYRLLKLLNLFHFKLNKLSQEINLPPKPPDIAHFDTGRTNRLILPNGVCPKWFSSGVEVLFIPLHWMDEIDVPQERKLEALLICKLDSNFDEMSMLVNPSKYLINELEDEKPEMNRESLLIFKSKLVLSKQQWRLNCPPMVKGFCDHQKRVYAVEHSMGVTIWSPFAFNEHFG